MIATPLFPSFPSDRWGHATELYSFFHDRQCLWLDVVRFLEDDVRLGPADHLLACRSPEGFLRIVGVAVPGATIIDSSRGDPDWAIGKTAGAGIARQIRRTKARRQLVALDIPTPCG